MIHNSKIARLNQITFVVRPEGEAGVRDVDEVERVEDGVLREAEVDAGDVLDGQLHAALAVEGGPARQTAL